MKNNNNLTVLQQRNVNVKSFNNDLFGEVRFVELNGKHYAVASDIAKILGYARPNNAINTHCKGATLIQGVITDGMGRKQNGLVIPEGDIYRLIVKSKLPQAEKFESWVFDEVLPQIRLTGGYIPVKEEDSDEMIMAKALQIMNKTLEKKEAVIQQQQKVIQEQQPKVEYHDAVLNPKNLVTIRDISKDLGMTANKLNKLLHDKKIQFKRSNGWVLYSDYDYLVTEGFADYKITQYGQQLRWTEKGRKWIIDLFEEERNRIRRA